MKSIQESIDNLIFRIQVGRANDDEIISELRNISKEFYERLAKILPESQGKNYYLVSKRIKDE